MDLTNYSLFGDRANTSYIPADMLNSNADGSTDWGAVLAAGIRGATQGAISASVGEKFRDGQLIAGNGAAYQSQRTTQLLLVGLVLFFVLKD